MDPNGTKEKVIRPTGEEQSSQPQSAEKPADAPLSDEMASKLGAILSEFVSPILSLRETLDKTYTASIAYMDRVVLLAGGTLTLTFTALATISGHLRDAGQTAVYSGYVIAECWLLVLVIMFGLLYSRLLIALRASQDRTLVVRQMPLFARIKMLGLNVKSSDPKAFPDFEVLNPQKQQKRLAFLATASSLIVHVSLTTAFICLAVFIQGNIGVILTTVPSVVLHK